MNIFKAIKAGAKTFAHEFRIELAAQRVARGNLALQHDKLSELTPAQLTAHQRDVDEILKRSVTIVRAAKAPKQSRYWAMRDRVARRIAPKD